MHAKGIQNLSEHEKCRGFEQINKNEGTTKIEHAERPKRTMTVSDLRVVVLQLLLPVLLEFFFLHILHTHMYADIHAMHANNNDDLYSYGVRRDGQGEHCHLAATNQRLWESIIERKQASKNEWEQNKNKNKSVTFFIHVQRVDFESIHKNKQHQFHMDFATKHAKQISGKIDEMFMLVMMILHWKRANTLCSTNNLKRTECCW